MAEGGALPSTDTNCSFKSAVIFSMPATVNATFLEPCDESTYRLAAAGSP